MLLSDEVSEEGREAHTVELPGTGAYNDALAFGLYAQCLGGHHYLIRLIKVSRAQFDHKGHHRATRIKARKHDDSRRRLLPPRPACRRSPRPNRETSTQSTVAYHRGGRVGLIWAVL